MHKTFLLCAGAQKSGTTWLYNYLQSHPEANMGFCKEYHIFDSLYVPNCNHFFEKRVNQAKYLLNSENDSLNLYKANLLKLLTFHYDIDNYFQYFQSLLSKDKKLTGDITPSYSSLPVSAFKRIKGGAEMAGFEIKLLLLIRDPLKRCISAAKDDLRKGRGEKNETLESYLIKNYSSVHYQIRTRYDLTIKNIEQVFDSNQVLIISYENLFTEESVNTICRHLNISYRAPQFDLKINASNLDSDISDNLKRLICKQYEPVYNFFSQNSKYRYIYENWISSDS